MPVIVAAQRFQRVSSKLCAYLDWQSCWRCPPQHRVKWLAEPLATVDVIIYSLLQIPLHINLALED